MMAVGGPNERQDYHINETEVGFGRLFGKISVLDYLTGMVLSTQRGYAASDCGRWAVQRCTDRRRGNVSSARFS